MMSTRFEEPPKLERAQNHSASDPRARQLRGRDERKGEEEHGSLVPVCTQLAGRSRSIRDARVAEDPFHIAPHRTRR